MIRAISCQFVSQAEIIATVLEECDCQVITIQGGMVGAGTVGNVNIWIRRADDKEGTWAIATLKKINERLKFNGERSLDRLPL